MTQDDFTPGRPVVLAPDLVRVTAPNPSPMTFHGTNTYILGTNSLAVIDPGPDSTSHFTALLSAIGNRPVSHIIVTHSHLDHSPLARPLARATGAPVLAFGDALAGRSAVMTELAQNGLLGGGEGVDHAFSPDRRITDGIHIPGEGWQLTAIHTPGHLGNHLCLDAQGRVFTGDHIMGWASSLVSPPDGDVTDFMASCTRMLEIGGTYYPGHGAPIPDGPTRVQWLIDHRQSRERAILAALAGGHATLAAITLAAYPDIAPALHAAAQRNTFAHLIDLITRNLAIAAPDLGINAHFSPA